MKLVVKHDLHCVINVKAGLTPKEYGISTLDFLIN